MQRRALYARALKTSDVRTALLVLRDEAALEGLYPSVKSGGDASDDALRGPPPPLTWLTRCWRSMSLAGLAKLGRGTY